jgi:cellulose synthase/poly-beta-1,6-N-acetylglucosamine synthase-like glycosyltransferase
VIRSRIVPAFILLALGVILAGKLLFHIGVDPLLWMYGLLVTLVTFTTFLGAYRYYTDPALDPPDPSVKDLEPRVSCIIPVKNEEGLMRRCISSLLNGTYKNLEVVVVDDGSTDRTPAILDEIAAARPEVRVIHMPKNVGKKKAVEAAIPYTTGSIFAFVDSDSVVGKHAIERLVKAFNAHPNAGAVSAHGRALNAEKNILTRIQDTWYEGQFRLSKGLESVYGAVTCASGCLSAFRREAFEPFVHEWAHDTFLGKEFRFATDRQMTGYVLRGDPPRRRKGTAAAADGGVPAHPKEWEVLYSESARVWTEVPPTWKKFLRQQTRWKKSFIRNLFFTGRFYWRRPPLAAFAFYLGIMFVLVGPIIAFRAIYFLTAGGDLLSAPLYLSGVTFVGLLYGLDFKLRNPDSTHWVYRPLMSLISTFVLSWLLIYAALTIKNPSWLTR